MASEKQEELGASSLAKAEREALEFEPTKGAEVASIENEGDAKIEDALHGVLLNAVRCREACGRPGGRRSTQTTHFRLRMRSTAAAGDTGAEANSPRPCHRRPQRHGSRGREETKQTAEKGVRNFHAPIN